MRVFVVFIYDVALLCMCAQLLPTEQLCQLSEQLCQVLSCVQLFATPSTIVYQAPLSMGFSRQQY